MGNEGAGSSPVAFILDAEYRIAEYNEELKRICPDIEKGQVCYQQFHNRNYPCAGCPLYSGGEHCCYNPAFGQWMAVNCTRISYQGDENSYLVFSRPIRNEEDILSYYFESGLENGILLELNLTKDTFCVLYSRTGLCFLEEQKNSSLSGQVGGVHVSGIRKEFRESYLDFWNLETLPQRLRESWHPGLLCAEFQEQNETGTCSWTRQFLMQMPPNADGDFIVRCFTGSAESCSGSSRIDSSIISHTIAKLGLDPMTGLYRALPFFEICSRLLDQQGRIPYCMLAIDIPQLWLYNKAYGYEAGNALLCAIADVLKEVQRQHHAIAGYISKDDFALLLETEYAEEFYERLCENFAKVCGEAQMIPKVSGYQIRGGESSPNAMYDFAVNAWDKIGNRTGRIRWYEENLQRSVEHNWDISRDFSSALQNGEFLVYLQPQVNILTGTVVGAEALARWRCKQDTILAPGFFIPALEQNGMVTRLDCYIWEQAVKWLHDRLQAGLPVVPISLNISRKDIYALDLQQIFDRLARDYAVPRCFIHIELTENIYMQDYDICSETVEKLHQSGFEVMMDDFGSGQSSLHMLNKVSIDVLKLDMLFLDFDRRNNKKPEAIIRMVLDMARKIGIPVIAEGIETEQQLKLLQEAGCQFGQGYYFYRPMPVSDFEALLEES